MVASQNRRRLLVVSAAPPITSKPTLGGNHGYLLDLLAALKPLDLEIHIAGDDDPAYQEYFDRQRDLGAIRHAVPFCSQGQGAAPCFDEVVRELRPLVVHVNGHHGWLAPGLTRSRALQQTPRRVYTMQLALAAAEPSSGGWKRFVPGSWAWKVRRSDRRFLELFHRVYSASRLFGQALVDRGLIGADQIDFVPNAVNVERFRPAGKADRTNVVIGGAGNLTEQKRFDILLRAFQRASAGRPDLTLRIAGEGVLEEKLKALTVELGLQDTVEFAGYQRDMQAFYNGLDLFVLSSDDEAAPYVALEAAACEVPSVLTDVGDVRLMFRDGEEAWVVPRGDIDALAAKMRALADDVEMRARFGAAGREAVLQKYSLQSWSARMRELFAKELELARSAS